MGRYTTGATHTDASKQISISFLKKNGYLEPGRMVRGTVNFSKNGEPTGSITISVNTVNAPYMQLIYTITDNNTGAKTPMDYKINLMKVPSNLGKGFRYYFLCPFSFKRCTIVYMAYGSQVFKHREAYKRRLYYRNQMESKRFRCYRFHSIEDKLAELYKGKLVPVYRGQTTRRKKRIEALELKYDTNVRLADILFARLIHKGVR